MRAALSLSVLAVAVLAGCSLDDLIPRPPDVAASDATAGDGEADVPDHVACEKDDDCAAFAGCCLDPRCQDGACVPFYVPQCCTQPGPCATTAPFHSGTCEATCEADGCVETLSLPAGSCAETLWSLALTPEAVLDTADSDPDDRVTWALTSARPFGGAPSLHAGDVVCPTYYDGPLGADCRPLDPAGAANAGAIALRLQTESFAVPADRPTLVQLWLWIDVGPGHVDGLTVSTTHDNGGRREAWDSRAASAADLPRGAWTPVLVDLTPDAGQSIGLALDFETLDGRDNDHPGVYIGSIDVRTLCADDLTCPAAAPCAAPREVRIAPFEVRACVVAPVDPGPSCAPCATDASCLVTDACDVARCEAGACTVSHELTAACCTPDASWPGDPSFEDALGPGWDADPGWAISGVESEVGPSSLHFGLPDGSAIAPPGESAEGAVVTPPIELPRDAPVWSFALALSTEWDGAPSSDNVASVDLLTLEVWPVAAATVAPAIIWDSRAIGGTTDGAWRRIRVALDAFAGQTVRLAWRFRTGDEHANDGSGVWVDDARVFRACPGCGSEALDEGCDPGSVAP